MNNYKKFFPIFINQPNLHYLDAAATALKPKSVIDAEVDYYTNYSANIHRGLYPMSEIATEKYEEVRDKVKGFIKAGFRDEIIFTSGTTDSINLVARAWGEKNLKMGDEIVTTVMEHHSNLVPWQELAKAKNLKISFLPIFNLQSSITNMVTKKTRLLAITMVSNVTGEVNPIKEIIKEARKINKDIVVVVDAAQAVAHMPINVQDLGCDFLAFSGHKMYGPTGVGVLYAKAKRMIEMEPMKFGGGMISDVNLEKSEWAEGAEKFEAGTPPIAQVIGLGAAIDFVNSIGWEEIIQHEGKLTKYLLDELKKLDYVMIVGSKETKNIIGVISFVIKEAGAHDVSDLVARRYKVATRAGFHCAIPLHRELGFNYGSIRASIGIYNTKDDIDSLIKGIIYTEEAFRLL